LAELIIWLSQLSLGGAAVRSHGLLNQVDGVCYGTPHPSSRWQSTNELSEPAEPETAVVRMTPHKGLISLNF
jgi:hypothetical protein